MFTHTKLNNLLIALAVSLASMLMVHAARAEFWFEDFTDGNISDSGIDWTFSPLSLSTSDGVELNSTNGTAGVVTADLPVRGHSWSIRTEARLLLDLGVPGAGVADGVADTFSGIAVTGRFSVGKAGQVLSERTSDLRPAEEDVIIQFDTFNDVLQIWAWRGEDSPAQDIEPFVEVEVYQPDGVPFLWTNSLIHPTSSARFSWIAISTEHMPLNMQVPLSDLIGDFSGDDVLDVADIDLLAAAVRAGTVHPQYDLNHSGAVDVEDHKYWVTEIKHTWIGDANLDGEFNSSDFVQVFQSGKFETDLEAQWNEGDWNGDQRFDSSDFVAAFQDGGFESGPRILRLPPFRNQRVPSHS